jgi:hypothetical protein
MAFAEWRPLTEAEVAHFDLVAPSTARRARLMAVPRLTPGAAGMTIGRWVLLRTGHEHRPALIAHELVHVEQWRDQGPVRFLSGYLASYFAARRAGATHRAAYLAIPAEQAARERAEVWSSGHRL